MSSQTTNLHLVKPASTENVSLNILNGNFDIIDQQFGTVSTWVPEIWDGTDTARFNLPSQSYWKIGRIYVMRIHADNVDISSVTNMMIIKGLPCTTVIGAGQVYINTASGSTFGADRTVQGSGNTVIIRPALTGSDVTGGTIGVLQLVIFGV